MARNSDGEDRPKSALRLRVVVVLFVIIFLCFLILDNFRIQTLASIRAFVEGEGLWSKAQKEAVIALHRYARSHDEKDFGDYSNAIQVPLGDHLARLELQRPDPDYEAVDRGYKAAIIRTFDGMARLFRRFRHVSTWRRRSHLERRDIARLQDAAANLRRVARGRPIREVSSSGKSMQLMCHRSAGFPTR